MDGMPGSATQPSDDIDVWIGSGKDRTNQLPLDYQLSRNSIDIFDALAALE